MAKRDIDRAQARRRRDLKILAADEAFQQAVHLLRRVLNVSPDTRRPIEGVIRQELGPPHRLDPNIHNAALNRCLFDLCGGGIHTDDRQKQNRQIIADVYYSLVRRGLKQAGGRPLKAGLFMDFDGAEFEMWADEMCPGSLVPWHDYVVFYGQQEWELHRNFPLGELVKRYDIWLNVTGRDLAWLHEVWPEIERMQGKRKPPPRKRGKPPGVPARPRRPVFGKTMAEVRAEIERDPGTLPHWGEAYVSENLQRRRDQDSRSSSQLAPTWEETERKKAQHSFDIQVTYHRSLRHLRLRSPWSASHRRRA